MIFVDSLPDFVKSNPEKIRPPSKDDRESVPYWGRRVLTRGFN